MTRGLACTKLTSNVEHFGTTALRKWIRHRILSSSIWHMVQYLVIAPSTMRNPSAPWTVAHPPCPKLANSPRPPARVRQTILGLETTTTLSFIHRTMTAGSRSIMLLIMPHTRFRFHRLPLLVYRCTTGGHASFQFDCQVKHHDGTSRNHQPFGQATESEISCGHYERAILPVLHDSASGTTSGRVGDSGRMDHVSGQAPAQTHRRPQSQIQLHHPMSQGR
ncbi:hypothetical protein EV401DRAFT_45518 [Pisolithus croceorrhizus]|nr:hypothetical protein EV401DRAFT_45518 [Pisolithus croceorrhizus]